MDNNLKPIFVIIPIYNSENYLSKCIGSILNQTYKNFMLILVDDGSTDNSLTLCKKFSLEDARIVIIHKDNGGVSSARNAGLDYLFEKKENGFVTFIDADDWVEEDYLDKLNNMLKLNNVDIVCSSFIYYKKDTIKSFKHIGDDVLMNSLEATRLLLRDESIQSHSVSKLFKIDLWKDIRYNPNLFYMEDQEVIYKVFYKAKNIYITNYAGYYYRQDNASATTKNGITNHKIISGLKGYYYPCLYEGFAKEDREYLLPSIHNALVNAYLMLIPYYKRNNSNKEERLFIQELKKYIKDNKLVKQYVPNNKNSSIKRMLYLMCPYTYPFIFKMGKKFYK